MLDSSNANIEYSLDAGVFVLKINRPEKKNALLPGMYSALAEGLRWADNADDVRVTLIRGVDNCFTSGNDVNGFVSNDSDSSQGRPSQDLMHALNDSKKPIVLNISAARVCAL